DPAGGAPIVRQGLRRARTHGRAHYARVGPGAHGDRARARRRGDGRSGDARGGVPRARGPRHRGGGVTPMSARSQAYAAFRICYFNGIIPLWRSPLLMAAVFLTPFSFLFFLFVIAPHALFPYGVVGGVLFTALFTGNGMLNDCAYLRLERQLQQVFVASPVSPLAYILGMALSELAFALPAMTLFLVILFLIQPIGVLAALGVVGLLLLTWLMATSLGFFISTLFSQLREIWPIGTLVFSLLSIIPPVFYPATE